MHAKAIPEDLSRIPRERLRLDHPPCRAWVDHVMALLAVRYTPKEALFWWIRMHTALRGRTPMSLLPTDWEPDCSEACFIEVYAVQGTAQVERNRYGLETEA